MSFDHARIKQNLITCSQILRVQINEINDIIYYTGDVLQKADLKTADCIPINLYTDMETALTSRLRIEFE